MFDEEKFHPGKFDNFSKFDENPIAGFLVSIFTKHSTPYKKQSIL